MCIFDKFLHSLIEFIHGHKKLCVAAAILENLHFLLIFGFPIKF